MNSEDQSLQCNTLKEKKTCLHERSAGINLHNTYIARYSCRLDTILKTIFDYCVICM